MKQQPRKDARAADADQGAKDAHHQLTGDQFIMTQRTDKQIAKIPRVELLDEGQGDAELAAEQHIPQQHGAEEKARRVLQKAVRGLEIDRHEPPQDHRHGRVVDHRQEARPRLEQQIRVATNQCADPPRGGGHAGLWIQAAGKLSYPHRAPSAAAASASSRLGRPRAISRNTSSMLSRP